MVLKTFLISIVNRKKIVERIFDILILSGILTQEKQVAYLRLYFAYLVENSDKIINILARVN